MMLHATAVSLLFAVCSAALLGGRHHHDSTESVEAQEAVQLLQAKLNMMTNSMYQRRILHVESVSSQIVAGVLWHVDFIWADTECRSNGENTRNDNCEVTQAEDAIVERCNASLFVQSWTDTHRISAHSCRSSSFDELYEISVGAAFSKHMQRMYSSDGINKKKFDSSVELFLGAGKENRPALAKFSDFEEYLDEFAKSHPSGQMQQRYRNYLVNQQIAYLLQKHEAGSARYGDTPFSDWSLEDMYGHLTTPAWHDTGYPPNTDTVESLGELPQQWDWRQHGVVTPVKNQGSCGSCWAFSTTGNIEGQWALKKKKLVSLSEQELVDCDKLDQGCNGGLPSNAYKEVIRLGGLETETEYPYEGSNDKCAFNRTDAAVEITGATKISSDETKMAQWLYQKGPISIGINAFAMMYYLGGVSHPFKFLCSPNKINHGVLIVGYGVQDGWFGRKLPYWIVKNSWGTWWGKHGYYYVYRGEGVCGLNTMATSAIV